MEFYARKSEDGRFQTLKEHLKNVADYMCRSGKFVFTLRLIGLLHDQGKARLAFNNYLLEGEGKRGSVIHSLQGAKTVLNYNFKNAGNGSMLLKEFLAIVISHHHNRLPDCISNDGSTSFFEELIKRDEKKLDYDEAYQNSFKIFEGLGYDVNSLFEKASLEMEELIERIIAVYKNRKNSIQFAFGLFAKYLYSYLIDADRLDAFLFESKQTIDDYSVTADFGELLERLEKNVLKLDNHGEISKIREKISLMCKEAKVNSSGIYHLSVPTGGGKTLSSLRFALANAKKYDKKRIVYVIPYLVIADQTRQVIKEQLELGDDSEILLEDHSNACVGNYAEQTDEQLAKRAYIQSSWNKPIVITTMVNFLESVMSARGGALRKFKNFEDCIFVFDEIQSLPIHSVNLFNEVVSFLSKMMGTIVLLCTATQPHHELAGRKNMLLEQSPSIISLDEKCLNVFKRTAIEPMPQMDTQGLCDFVVKKVKNEPSILAIVNTKKSARTLFEMLNNELRDVKVFHLSTNICPKNRLKIINEVKACLDNKQKMVLVATRIIEAGIDLSMSCVIRALAGFDSIIQAAGRCNRHGEFGQIKTVYVVPLTDENLDKLPDIKLGKEKSEKIFREMRDVDYLSSEVLERYYNYYFEAKKDFMDFALKNGATAYQLLSSNVLGRTCYKNTYGKWCSFMLAQGFSSVDDEYNVISNNTESLVVNYENSLELVEKLKSTFSLKEKIKIIKELSEFSIEVYKSPSLLRLYKTGMITIIDKDFDIKVLADCCYNDKIGFKIDGGDEFVSDSS